MSKSMLLLILGAKNKNDEAFLKIINKFSYTIMKFSYQLGYDEAKTDLTIALIVLVKRMDLSKLCKKDDGTITNFIYKSLKNKRNDLFDKYVKKDIVEIELNTDIIPATNDYNVEEKIFIEKLLNILTELQRNVITKKFIYNYSEIEIAKELHISRQAVNKAKNRGIKNLKNYIEKQNLKVL